MTKKKQLSNKTNKTLIIIVAILLGCLILGIGGILFMNYSKQKTYNEKISLGDKYLEKMEYENAILAYSDAINIYPKKSQGYISLSEVYVKNGDYESAKIVLSSAPVSSMKAEEQAKIEEKTESVQKVEEEAKKKAEEERKKAEEEAKRKAEAEAKKKAEAEAKKKAEEERLAAEAAAKAEAERLAAEEAQREAERLAAEEDAKKIEEGVYKYESGEHVSEFSLYKEGGIKKAKLMFWHNYGASSSDEDFFFNWNDGQLEYELLGNRSQKIFDITFEPNSDGTIKINVLCKEEYLDWETALPSQSWLSGEYK